MKRPDISQKLLNSDSWNDSEKNNVHLISGFVQKLMNEHKTDQVLEEYGNGSYIQHNRTIPDGMKGITGYLKNFSKQFPEFGYEVKRIIADGDYVIFHSHATIKHAHIGKDNKGFNIIDTWKIEDGKIVEHWDSIQPLDFGMRLYALFVGGNIKNSNGVF